MKKTTIYIVMAVLWPFLGLSQENNAIKPLYLQQSIPESIWEEQIEKLESSGSIRKASLKEYRGKLIILDFWATWCTACIKNFQHLDTLQNQFKENLQIILVNANIKGDTQSKIQNRLNGTNLFSLINNTSLKALFPYEFIPHYVWIDEKGKFYALTTADSIDFDSIQNHISKQKNNQ